MFHLPFREFSQFYTGECYVPNFKLHKTETLHHRVEHVAVRTEEMKKEKKEYMTEFLSSQEENLKIHIPEQN